jgi:hypothetical protein
MSTQKKTLFMEAPQCQTIYALFKEQDFKARPSPEKEVQ